MRSKRSPKPASLFASRDDVHVHPRRPQLSFVSKWDDAEVVTTVLRDSDRGSMLSLGPVRWLTMRENQFALLDGTLERGLFRFVEQSVMIGVVAGYLRIHFDDVVEHHLDIWLISIRRVVGRQFNGAISNGFGEGFFFFVIQLAILVCVECGDLREELRQMRGHGSGIAVMLRIMAGGSPVVNLSDGKAAH